MTWWPPRASSGGAVLLALAFGASAPKVSGQSPSPAAARPQKSTYGTLLAVEPSVNGAAMKTNDGKRIAWRFPPRVIEEVAKVKIGAPMIVIYREISDSDKRVTAVAFPGATATPTYVNTTGSRVIMRTAPMIGDECGQVEPGTVTESILPPDRVAETQDACWCCAAPGESCTPGNKTGNGRAFLVTCFK